MLLISKANRFSRKAGISTEILAKIEEEDIKNICLLLTELSFGMSVEVLEPEPLRREIEEVVSELNRRYNG